MEECRWRNLAK